MNENHGITPNEAAIKLCPVMPPYGLAITTNGSEISRATSISINVNGMRMCQGQACMMWTWIAGSNERGYCGLRGHVVLP